MKINNPIKEVCRLCGFTQQDLAQLLRVDKNTVARWARGELNPSPPLFARLQQILEEPACKSAADGNVLDRWDQIKGEKDLQRFANHLARFEFWPEQIFASNPYGGGDEGWDGGSNDASILVQAKFSDDVRHKAFKYIKNSFVDEYGAIKSKRIRKYILATNVDLLPSQRQLLQSCKTTKGPEIIIWNKETLTLLAQEHRWVLHYYFHYPLTPRLIPSFVYLESNNFESPCIGFGDILKQLVEFCNSDDCLMIVKGGAHVGKTRLLWELLNHIRRELPTTMPWVLRSEWLRPCREALDNEVNISHGKHVILLDDAQTHYEDVEDLGEYTHAKKENLKAILFANSSTIPLIQKALKKRAPRDHKVVEIPKLTSDQLAEIFLNASGGYKPDRLDRVVKTLDYDLFLITEIGSKLKSRTGDVKVIDTLKDVKLDLVRHTSDLLELNSKQADLLLTELSLIAPFPTLNSSELGSKIHSQIASYCGLSQDDYQLCIHRLSKGKIVSSVGNNYSFKSKCFKRFKLY